MAGEPTKDYPLGVVLSLTTGMLLCPFDEVHEFVEFMAGEPIWTHQLPRVGKEVEEVLKRQHPALAEVTPPELQRDSQASIEEQIKDWVAEQAKVHGEMITCRAMHAEEHQPKGPITELAEMIGDSDG